MAFSQVLRRLRISSLEFQPLWHWRDVWSWNLLIIGNRSIHVLDSAFHSFVKKLLSVHDYEALYKHTISLWSLLPLLKLFFSNNQKPLTLFFARLIHKDWPLQLYVISLATSCRSMTHLVICTSINYIGSVLALADVCQTCRKLDVYWYSMTASVNNSRDTQLKQFYAHTKK